MKNSLLVAGVAVLAAGCGDNTTDPCNTSGAACQWAGTGERGYNNDNPQADKKDSKLYFPADLTFGPDGRAYIADFNNHRIRRVEADNRLVSIVGVEEEGDGAPNDEDRLPVENPQGADGTIVKMNHPTDVEFGPDGKLYIGAWHNNKIRVLDVETNILKTLAGNSYGFAGDGGPCYNALFNQPKAVVFGPDGSLYTSDQRNVRIRKIDPNGIISTIAGIGTIGNAGDGGDALSASWGWETGTTPRPGSALAVKDNTLYVADSMNNRIRKIDLATNIVSAVAGDPAGTSGYVEGAAGDARFNYPHDLEFGPEGKLYVADRYNNVIRAIDLDTGMTTTVAGNGKQCDSINACAFDVDGLAPLDIQLNQPQGIAFDAAGNMFIADSYNHRIIKVTR